MIEKDGQTEALEDYLLFNQSSGKMLEPEPVPVPELEPSLGLPQTVGMIEKDGQTETLEGYLLFNQSSEPEPVPVPELEPSLGLPQTVGVIEKDGQTETLEGYLLFNQSNGKMLEPEPEPVPVPELEPSLGLTQAEGLQHSILANPTSLSPLRDKRNRNRNKTETGLRNFTKNVMEKVQQSGVTSFDKVEDEMFKDMCKRTPKKDASSLQKECARKNIRRRVYDVLNVMDVMEMISKDKSQITWLGLPPEITEEQQQLEKERKDVEESIQQKTSELQHLIIQQIAYKNLLEKRRSSKPNQSSSLTNPKISLPFIAVKTSKNTVITHSTSNNEFEHVFNFDQPFEILDNMEVLNRMGMAFGLEKHVCTEENLEKSKAMVSKELEPYLVQIVEEGPLAQKHQKKTISGV